MTKRRAMKRLWLAAVLSSTIGCALVVRPAPPNRVAPGNWIAQTYRQAPADNPLKGFVPFGKSQTAFPHSMEWSYFAWKDLQTDYEQFDWRALDSFLADAAARGHQTAFRVYADYPDTPYGVPSFLAEVPKHAYSAFGNGTHATSYSPDYDNQDLKRAMLNIIRALGERYDGDPRLGFVVVGFVGFWGEWHTYRSECDCDTWMPSRQTQRAVLDAFDRSFNRTRVLVRQPG